MDYKDLYDMVTALPAGAIAQEEAQTHQYEAMKGIIEEELEAYIVDKGEALGADCTAQVTCTPGEGEVPVPHPGHRHRRPDPRPTGGHVPLPGAGAGHPLPGANL